MSKYSYSKMDTYVQCPFKFKLKYIDEHKVFTASVATEVGTMIHECEEAIANNIINGQDINYIELKNNIIVKSNELQHKYEKDFIEPDKSGRTYWQKIYEYLETGIYKLEQFMNDHPTYSIIGAEKEFDFIYGDNELNGFIDRIFYDHMTNTYIIQDIKTYAIPVEKDKLTTPLQFVVYTLAAMELYKCSPEQVKCQYYLPFCDLTQDAGTNGYLARGEDKMSNIFESIISEDFHAKQSCLCYWCNFCSTNPNAPEETKYLCPYFCRWTREHKVFTNENEWQGMENHQAILEAYQNKVRGN